MTQHHEDDNILIDAEEDDWAWRRKIRSNPATAKVYRTFIFILGLIVVIGGVIALPAPGPGWLIIFAGLGIWATEFEWAKRVLDWAKAKVKSWELWMRAQPWWVSALVGLATLIVVLAIFWALFAISGVPGFFPDGIENWLKDLPGLG
ncbi:TIGR02611 family protein [Demetria terragena]|uniref:TIGR02611 family protein n=1 Tax=Demetria terragena TaxID=63959 RepID=UPI00037F5C34|nr:TIGR02611 family protein [Demetria terragena]